MNVATTIRLYREALGRARNVAHDLEDFEWIHQTDIDIAARLQEIASESGRVASLRHILQDEARKPEGA